MFEGRYTCRKCPGLATAIPARHLACRERFERALHIYSEIKMKSRIPKVRWIQAANRKEAFLKDKAMRRVVVKSVSADTPDVRIRRTHATNLNELVVKGVYADGRTATVSANLLGASVVIAPSALSFVKEQTRKTKIRYSVSGGIADYFIPAALIAAGITAARTRGAAMVTIRDVSRGWSTELSVCPGNCPPWLCAGKSILDRKEVIYELEGLTGKLIRDSFDMPDDDGVVLSSGIRSGDAEAEAMILADMKGD